MLNEKQLIKNLEPFFQFLCPLAATITEPTRPPFYPTRLLPQIVIHLLWMVAFSQHHFALLAYTILIWAGQNHLIDMEHLIFHYQSRFLVILLQRLHCYSTSSTCRHEELTREGEDLFCGPAANDIYWQSSSPSKKECIIQGKQKTMCFIVTKIFLGWSKDVYQQRMSLQLSLYLHINMFLTETYVNTRAVLFALVSCIFLACVCTGIRRRDGHSHECQAFDNYAGIFFV